MSKDILFCEVLSDCIFSLHCTGDGARKIMLKFLAFSLLVILMSPIPSFRFTWGNLFSFMLFGTGKEFPIVSSIMQSSSIWTVELVFQHSIV